MTPLPEVSGGHWQRATLTSSFGPLIRLRVLPPGRSFLKCIPAFRLCAAIARWTCDWLIPILRRLTPKPGLRLCPWLLNIV